MDTVINHWVESGELREQRLLPWADSGNSTLWSCVFRGQEFVYKEYTDDFRAEANHHALERLIAWRSGLPDGSRTRLDTVAAWPRYGVRKNGLLRGVLLPFAPVKFFDEHAGGPRPRMLAQLIRLRADGRVRQGATIEVKHCALGHAADVLLWFHSQQVVVNDVREMNILCTANGSAVFYVDCDVMIGPWGAVGPAAAPGYMTAAIPGLDRPSRETDVARLAWMSAAILLDDIALPEVREEWLLKITDPGSAGLLTASSRPSHVDQDAWRRLAGRWTAPPWRGTAPVSPASGTGRPGPAPPDPPLPGPTRRRPPLDPTRKVVPLVHAERASDVFRVPGRFRLPDPVIGQFLIEAERPAERSVPPLWAAMSTRNKAILAGAVLTMLLLCGLATLSMSMRGLTL